MEGVLKTISSYESNVVSYAKTFPAVFSRAVGSTIWDVDGRSYIDFFSGAGALNYGHNHPEIKQAMMDYLLNDGILHGLDMTTEAKAAFITTFIDKILKPRGLEYKMQFTGPTGANGVEAALKLARLVTGRKNIISFKNAFHGVSLGALSVTSNPWYRDVAGVPLENVFFLPYNERPEEAIDALGSGAEMPAAIIVETVQGEGGVNVASKEWLRALRKVASDRQILLIVDDVQAGCGRTGDFFSFEFSEITPDIVVLSKSISGSGLPMSLLLMKPEFDKWKSGQHNGTFRGNNLAFVSATKAIEIFWKDREFSQAIQDKGGIIERRLNSIAKFYPKLIKTVRGRGMFWGLEFLDPSVAENIRSSCFKNGLIIELSGVNNQVLKFLPALTIDTDLLERGLSIIDNSIQRV